MKKMMMMAAVMGLVGTAGAAGGPASASVNFNANVQNVCLLGGGAFTGNYGPLSTPAFNYVANGGANQGVSYGPLAPSAMLIKCTKGTTLTVSTSTASGDSDAGTGPDTLTGGMALSSSTTGDSLQGVYTVAITKATASDGADTYGGSVGFRANANQWGVAAGTDYTGTLTITLSYN